MINDRDLFDAPYWNFFDWTAIDSGQRVVLHNSHVLRGRDRRGPEGRRRARRPRPRRLAQGAPRRARAAAINRLWDREERRYPGLHPRRRLDQPVDQPAHELPRVLFDVLDPTNAAAAQRNLLEPARGDGRIGSPFAALYLYDALEKLGLDDAVVKEIYRNYLPMLDAGADHRVGELPQRHDRRRPVPDPQPLPRLVVRHRTTSSRGSCWAFVPSSRPARRRFRSAPGPPA